MFDSFDASLGLYVLICHLAVLAMATAWNAILAVHQLVPRFPTKGQSLHFSASKMNLDEFWTFQSSTHIHPAYVPGTKKANHFGKWVDLFR